MKEVSTEGREVRTFKSLFDYHLHSLSLMDDCEHFLTADQSRINLWNLHSRGNPVYSLIDYNRHKVYAEDEVIKSVRCDPASPTFVYTTNTGKINICDLRESSNF